MKVFSTNLMLIVLLIPALAFSQDPAQAGRDAANQAINNYGTISGLSDNVFKPLQGQVDMNTLDSSQAFSGQITCEPASKFIETLATDGSLDGIGDFNVSWDADMDGVMESSMELTSLTQYGHFSGVCNNGYISCETGTWNNCRGYKLDYNNNNFEINLSSIANLESCYCISNLCSNSFLTIDMAVETASEAALNAFIDKNSAVSISEKVINTNSAYYVGQKTTSCFSSNVDTLTGHFNNPYAIATDAQAEAMLQSSDPQSIYNVINNTYTNQVEPKDTHTCSITRAITQQILDIYDVIEPITGSGSTAVVNTCGQYCIDVIIGQPTDNWLCGNCGIWEESYDFYIHYPNKIGSAELLDVYYDDHMQIWIGDLASISTTGYCAASPECVWAGPHDNFPPDTDVTYTPCLYESENNYYYCQGFGSSCDMATLTCAHITHTCEHSTSWVQHPGNDFTSYFQTAGPLQTKVRVGYSGCGEGYARIRLLVTDWCEWSETIQNDCQLFETDPNCQIKNETIDSVPTIVNFSTTGDRPVPSTVGVCNQTVQRDWMLKERIYMCNVAGTFDLSGVSQRIEAITESTSRTASSFTYSDYYKDASGNWTNFDSAAINMYDAPSVEACVEVCKVQSVASDTHASTTGNTTDYNVSNTRNEFQYKNCDNNTCPAGPGETIISGCSCETDFNQAFTAMQLLRLAGEDIECAPH